MGLADPPRVFVVVVVPLKFVNIVDYLFVTGIEALLGEGRGQPVQ